MGLSVSTALPLYRVRSDMTNEWLDHHGQWTTNKALAGAWSDSRADTLASSRGDGDRYAISVIRVGKRYRPPPTCDYCGGQTELVGARVIYPHRNDIDGWFWRCRPCGAYVGCHPGTINALGRLANAELRAAKVRAHAAFDPLWRVKMRRDGCSKSAARAAGYAWLAEQLGIDPKLCHIGMFDVAMCRRVEEVCRSIIERRRRCSNG